MKDNSFRTEKDDDVTLERVRRSTMKTYYLAHPGSPDEHYTYEQNMAHALKVARICWDAGFRVDMPWWTICHYLDNNNPEHRDQGIEYDCHMVTKHDGIILTGHRLSSGMDSEAMVADMHEIPIINACGVPDRNLVHYLRKFL